MYEIVKRKIGKCGILRLHNKKSSEYVEIIPLLGGRIHKLVLSNQRRLHDLLYTQSIENWSIPYFAGAKLFPFPNRIANGQYTFQDRDRILLINEQGSRKNAIHGLVHNANFEVKSMECSNSVAKLTLECEYLGGIPGYEYSFYLKIVHTLSDQGYKALTFVKNIGPNIMPMGDGWHPYIQLGSKVDNLQISTPSNLFLQLDENLIPTGEVLKMTQNLGSNDLFGIDLNHCFIINGKTSLAKTRLTDPITGHTVVIWQDASPKGYGFVQYYIPQERECIAIEPMSCAPNAFNNKIGLIELSPDEIFSAEFGIYMEPQE